MNDTFYFIIYTSRDRSSIKVIDLARIVDYQRNDWLAVNDENFNDPTMAIEYAKALAKQHGLVYEAFESRYDSSLNEKLFLTLD